MESDRRKDTRFSVTDDAYAVLGPNFTKVGRIQDLSMGGLAFNYLTDEENESEDPSVEIFLRKGQFHISEIPCKIVYSTNRAAPENTLLSNQMPIRKRCGVKFSRLTEDHEKKLEDFLKNHAVGEVGGGKR